MLRLTAVATMIVIGCHAIPLKSQVDAVKAEGHVDVVKAQGECMGTFMCTKNGGPDGASQCPCKGDCACVGGTVRSNDELSSYIDTDNYASEARPPVGLAIVFNSVAKADGSAGWSYTLRMNETSAIFSSNGGDNYIKNIPDPAEYTNDLERGTTKYAFQYAYSGFSTVQHLLDSWILANAGNAGG